MSAIQKLFARIGIALTEVAVVGVWFNSSFGLLGFLAVPLLLGSIDPNLDKQEPSP